MLSIIACILFATCLGAAAIFLFREFRRAPIVDENERPIHDRHKAVVLCRGQVILIYYDESHAAAVWPEIRRQMAMIEEEACAGK